MRYSAVAIAAAMTLLSLSTSLRSQAGGDRVAPPSVALVARAGAARAAGNLDAATDLLETALAVDPHNRAAYVALGQVAQARGLPGRAIRLYRDALLIDPTDLGALEGQGEALVAKGAVDRARTNLTRIRTLCGRSACPAATGLAAVIAQGPPLATAQAANPAKPTVAKE